MSSLGDNELTMSITSTVYSDPSPDQFEVNTWLGDDSAIAKVEMTLTNGGKLCPIWLTDGMQIAADEMRAFLRGSEEFNSK